MVIRFALTNHTSFVRPERRRIQKNQSNSHLCLSSSWAGCLICGLNRRQILKGCTWRLNGGLIFFGLRLSSSVSVASKYHDALTSALVNDHEGVRGGSKNYESKLFHQHSHTTQLECFPAAREKYSLKLERQENFSIDYKNESLSKTAPANVSSIRGFPSSTFSRISRLPTGLDCWIRVPAVFSKESAISLAFSLAHIRKCIQGRNSNTIGPGSFWCFEDRPHADVEFW